MRRSHVAALAVIVAGLSSSAEAQTAGPATASCALPQASGVTQVQIVSGQREREYRLFVPAGYDGRTHLPLVLDLHPSGGTSAGQAKTSGLEGLAVREGFVVAALQAIGGRWNVPVTADRPDDVAYVADVIDHVAATICIDPARVYATGFSGGARMSSLLACRLNGRIAAIAPVAGIRWPGPCDGRAVPVLTFHGLADRQNTYEGGVEGRGGEWVESVPEALAGWAGHNGCTADAAMDDPAGPLSTLRYSGCRDGADVRIVRIDDLGHTWPRNEVDATAEIWAFFQSQRLRP